jgi:hypothetical protein
MSRTAQWARALDAAERDIRTASLADLHEKLGRTIADVSGTIRPENHSGHVYRVGPSPLRDLAIEARCKKPSLHETRAHLASMTPARRAELEAEWDVPVSDGRRTGPEAF